MVFQNSERLKTGKFYRRTKSDLSIQWIMDAYRNMPEQAENIVIVPVVASYDRIFETTNLTNNMVGSQGKLETITDAFKKTMYFGKDQLGEVFIKYLEPIHLKDYLATLPAETPDPAFKLTEELYLRQQQATPVTLNSLIAAVLLYEKSDNVKMTDLLQRTATIYTYVKVKTTSFTYMQLKPQQILVEKHIDGLGFKMKERGKKTCQILLDQKNTSQRLFLALAHYSLRLSSVFVFESGFAFVLKNHFKCSATPLKTKDLHTKGMMWLDIFKNEHVFDDRLDDAKYEERLDFMASAKLISYDKVKDEISLIESPNPLVELFV